MGYTEGWRGTKIGREGEKRKKRKGGSKTETLERLYICRERHTNTEEERYRERRGTKRSHEIPCSKNGKDCIAKQRRGEGGKGE